MGNVLEMCGTPWEPIPGKYGQHIPVDMVDNGEYMGLDSENEETRIEKADDEADWKEFRSISNKCHVSRNAVKKFGDTPGCAACSAAKARGDRPGRLGHNHSDECRKRIMEAMEHDPEYRHMIRRLRETSGGQTGDNEVNMGNVNTNREHLQQHKTNTNKTEQGKTSQTTKEKLCSQIWSHVKKAMAHVQANIQKNRNCDDGGSTHNLGSQLNRTMLNMLINQMQVAKVYGPPRVVETANKICLRGGLGLDLTTHDEYGPSWGFNGTRTGNRAVRNVLEDKPLVLIRGPMCTEYSAMNRINHSMMSKEDVEQRMAYAREHLECCMKLYEIQRRSGRYFLHGHPARASSWEDALIRRLRGREGVQRVVGDQCQFGLKSTGKDGIAPARGGTRFRTNAVRLAKRLGQKWPSKPGHQAHRHVILEGGGPKAAQVYPDKLCRQTCLGTQEQIHRDRNGQYLLTSMQAEGAETTEEMMQVVDKLRNKYKIVEEEEDEIDVYKAWDDVGQGSEGSASRGNRLCAQNGPLQQSAHHRGLPRNRKRPNICKGD